MADQTASSVFFASVGRITAGVVVGIVVVIAALWAVRSMTRQRQEAPNLQATTIQPLSSAPQTIIADTTMVGENRFNVLSFAIYRSVNVVVNVHLKQGPPIDAYIVDEKGLNVWLAMAANQQIGSFSYIPALSMAPLAAVYTATARLAPGKYALVIDNSRAGAARPPFHILAHDYSALVAYSVTAN
jgi:hypothetical protein